MAGAGRTGFGGTARSTQGVTRQQISANKINSLRAATSGNGRYHHGDSRDSGSSRRYSCLPGMTLIGRNDATADNDERARLADLEVGKAAIRALQTMPERPREPIDCKTSVPAPIHGFCSPRASLLAHLRLPFSLLCSSGSSRGYGKAIAGVFQPSSLWEPELAEPSWHGQH